MSLPRYPEYKDSRVEWLRDIPAHWAVSPLKHLVSFTSGGTPSKEIPEYWDGSVPWASAKDLKSERLSDTTDHITEYAISSGAASLVPAGTVLVVVRGMILARTFPVTQTLTPMAINQDLKGVRSTGPLDTNFLPWLLKGSADESLQRLDEAGHGTKALRMDAWSSMRLPVPPHEEQRAIAVFLDRETTKIDALIAEKEKLLALLAEKRQVTISHAVTKGLNPDTRMKDSGVAWLAEVPAHWKVGKAGFYISVLPGYAFPSSEFSSDESNVRLLRGINVGVGKLKWDEVVHWQRTEADGLDGFELRAGDIVIGMDRPLISTGIRVAPMKEEDLPCLLLQRVAKVQVGASINGRFIMRLLSSRAFEAHFTPETTGVSVPHISGEQICSFVIPVPPLDEQRRICDFVEAELAKLDALISEARLAIALLGERRTALIAAAVTGQIDVRQT